MVEGATAVNGDAELYASPTRPERQHEEVAARTARGRDPMNLDSPLAGLALLIWQEVVYGGNHLTLHRDTRPVAVVVPAEDYEAMRAALVMEKAR